METQFEMGCSTISELLPTLFASRLIDKTYLYSVLYRHLAAPGRFKPDVI